MVEYSEAFVGIDAAKSRNAIAIAEAGREGEIRYLGEVDATPQSLRKVVARLAAKYQRLYFCYEAGGRPAMGFIASSRLSVTTASWWLRR